MINNDTLDLRLAQLRDVHCPHTVDVADNVMMVITQQSGQSVLHPHRRWYRYVAVAAACIVALFAVNLTILYTSSYDEVGIGNLITEVYNYEVDNGVAEESLFVQSWYDNII